MTTCLRTLALAAALLAPAAASAQSDILLQLRSGSPLGDRFRVDSASGFVAIGQLGFGIIPASGAGFRLMWHPFKAAFRAGHANGTEWDDANVGFYSWAGGEGPTASGATAFAFGNLTTASGVSATAFGSQATAAGNGAFAAGILSHACGSASVALGLRANAGVLTAGDCPVGGSGPTGVALGTYTTADGDYSVAIGFHASTNGHAGAIILGDASTGDSIEAVANNEFAVRAAGGIRLRSNATLTNGCNINAGGATWVCTSSRTLKDHFAPVSGELLLSRLRAVPVNYWQYKEEAGNVRHVGPFAEDFSAAFGLGNDDKAIGTVDIAGVNFAGVKALEERTATQAQRIEALESEVAVLKALMQALVAKQAGKQ